MGYTPSPLLTDSTKDRVFENTFVGVTRCGDVRDRHSSLVILALLLSLFALLRTEASGSLAIWPFMLVVKVRRAILPRRILSEFGGRSQR